MTYQGQYGYYVTESYPFIISCYVGTVSQTFKKLHCCRALARTDLSGSLRVQ